MNANTLGGERMNETDLREGSHYCTEEPCPYWCLRPKAERVDVGKREAGR